ncbi:MAG: thioredoxin [Candidatus Kapaibacterium sp.]|nr:thioredoxin [Ignavibacteriota bacterium]MCB9220662.1 thioredoxin [Ignavibacteria bacterium]
MFKNTRLIILISLLPIVFMACGNKEKTEEFGNSVISEKLDAKSFHDKMTETPDFHLIDVRTPEEYQSGNLEGSINLNIYDTEFEKELQKLDKNKPVFVYCRSGGRSASAATKMIDMGFKEVYDMKGGITAWNANNLSLSNSYSNKDNVNELTSDDYLKKISNNQKLVLVDFNAEWCAPCKKLSPILDKLVEKHGSKMELLKIDVDRNPTIAKQLRIEGLPTLKLYKNGKEVWQTLGLIDEESLNEVIVSNI